MSFPWLDPNNPVGGDTGPNTPPPVWFGPGCNSICVSTVSQQDADLCAQRQAFICAHSGEQIFVNNVQRCFGVCPDGLPFTYVVPAGQFAGTTQAAADAQAAAFACDALETFIFCLGSLTNETCLGDSYSSTLRPSRGTGPFHFQVVNGSVPPGLNVSATANSLTISGTPTQSGNFTFSIQATDPFGNFMLKNYAICVVGIDQSTLPDATIGTAYSQQLTATSCAGTSQSWQVVAGSLPAGLSLDEQTGKITGTPTGPAGNVLFKVRFQDSST